MIAYEKYGHGEHKIFGIHGWFGDEKTFKSLELSLDPAEFECVWLAHRGYGRSIDLAGRYDMAEMASDAIAVANHLNWSRFSVMGHSMGGKAIQLIAASVPDRVRKLIAVSPVSADPVPFDPATRDLFEKATDSAACRKTIVDFSTSNLLSSAWVDGIVSASVAGTKSEAFGAYMRSWANDDFSNEINDMETDALVLVGAQDPVITASVCEHGFRQRYRQLVIKELQGSGHYPMDEVPLLFGAEVLKHLRS
ncbi:alpha/beta fold hydrolase [Caballeronia sordidicola]|uniref:Hydrolase, alpha/beta fold family n=1 Tax=Caballeronia sordidicola TaxID=196367 RepID=A0A242MXP2_CABSO|nr:alpha/beta hydrolase [Caballeronia sordidicola]OTP76201.1 hydrolase, alpha/beta fold family [Caballeronia sordidicola]